MVSHRPRSAVDKTKQMVGEMKTNKMLKYVHKEKYIYDYQSKKTNS
jgi:hypothetical protein